MTGNGSFNTCKIKIINFGCFSNEFHTQFNYHIFGTFRNIQVPTSLVSKLTIEVFTPLISKQVIRSLYHRGIQNICVLAMGCGDTPRGEFINVGISVKTTLCDQT